MCMETPKTKLDSLGDLLADVAVSVEVCMENVQNLDDFDLRGLPQDIQAAVAEIRNQLLAMSLDEAMKKLDDVLAVIEGE